MTLEADGNHADASPYARTAMPLSGRSAPAGSGRFVCGVAALLNVAAVMP